MRKWWMLGDRIVVTLGAIAFVSVWSAALGAWFGYKKGGAETADALYGEACLRKCMKDDELAACHFTNPINQIVTEKNCTQWIDEALQENY